ncbi:MAG: SH3 domain-containing protein, partial [Christensenellaceae bacterium]
MHSSIWKKGMPLLLAALLLLAGVLPALAAAGASPQSSPSSGTVKLASSASSLNVRSGPGTRYSTLGSLRHGAAVTITGEQSGWYSISFHGRTGYVKASYITPSLQPADSSTAFTGHVKLASSSGRLNVRKGPGTGYAAMGQLANGAKVSVTKAQGGWYAIAYNGSTGYVSSAYVVK